MADGLCGPSNALQNLQKHSSVDRTLQQDRLTTRQSPSQGFRSSPGPGAGILDAEFQAFQASQLPLHQPEHYALQPPGFPSQSPSQLGQQPGAGGWATDFQRLSLASAGPEMLQHHAPPSQSHGGWQHEFSQQQQQRQSSPAYAHKQTYNVPVERLSTLASLSPGFPPMYGEQMSAHSLQAQDAQSTSTAEVFDDEAFARAFDQAAEARSSAEQSTRQDQDVLPDESAALFLRSDHLQEQEKLGADLIHDPDGAATDQHQDSQQDPDALARTAADLLDRVKDNQTDKFRNSQFLQLMRHIRDKEVTVEGDKMVDAQGRDIQSMQAVTP
ncbi:MAG: hypothetical protein M1818_005314 [Claussenomyces sp. TS43310]|nr:MAG: hypothetical protein M1818_005314 [Claussenomyces sp. TS43310]